MTTGAVGSVGSVGVVGAGLIGGSVALRLRDLGVPVVVSDPDPATLDAARAAGLATGDVVDLQTCDVVVLATPLDALPGVLAQVARLAVPVVIDVGSVKAPVAAAAAAAGLAARFVGCHPMSGTEESGFAHASAGLLVGVPWAVTWPDAAAQALLAPVVAWLGEAFDATVVVLPDDEHDRAVALVSHAPHVLANALLGVVEDAVDVPAARHLAAGSFRDGTRVAGRNARRTRHMLAENAGALAGVLDALIAELTAYRRELGGPALLARLEQVAGAEAGVRTPEVTWTPCPDLAALLGERRGQTLAVRPGPQWAAIR